MLPRVLKVLRILALGIAFGLLAAYSLGAVKAQEGPHHPAANQALHDKFYSTWMQPPERKSSCCNNEDCYPTKVVIEGGVCKAWKPEFSYRNCDDYSGECYVSAPKAAHWVVFDCALMEENRPDPEQSPDGQSHACIAKYTDQVYCAARGSLQ